MQLYFEILCRTCSTVYIFLFQQVTDCVVPSFQYRVSIFNSTDSDDFSREATVSSDTTTHTFTVLKGRTYNVTVLATNVIGEGTLAHTTIGEWCEDIEGH